MTVDMRKLRNLAEQLRAQAGTATAQQRHAGRSWYRIENADQSSADVYLYDMIGDWGVTAQDFVNDLRALSVGTINMHVNSPGGEVFDGLAIYESLINHPAKVTAHVDGLAASSASFIVQAADRIVMAPRARMMIHDAHGITIGNAGDMRKMADLLDDLSDNIAEIYATRAGGSRASWREAMQAAQGGPDGTWYDAEGAVSAKLADEIARTEAPEAGAPRAEHRQAPRAEHRQAAPEWTWNPGEFLGMLDEISNPPEKVVIPDGRALLDGLRSA
jgi:ATP-dependent protease ClpP protease subunit